MDNRPNGNILSRITEIETELDQFEKNNGLPERTKELPTNPYVNMTKQQLEKLSPEDCGQISYELNSFALHIQRTVNRQKVRRNWAEENINFLLADKVDDYQGYSYKERWYKALKDNTVAIDFNKIKVEAQTRIDNLEFTSNLIRNMAESLNYLQKAKKNAY